MNINNFYKLNSNQKKQNISQNSKEKVKFITNPNNLSYTSVNSIGNPIDIESYLRNSESNTKSKTLIQLKQKFSPNNHDILYSNSLNEKKKNITKINQVEPYKGPGRGIGDINISDDVRFGIDTRRYNEEYRNNNESLINDRFQFIDDEIQDPNNCVLPFPRGGVST